MSVLLNELKSLKEKKKTKMQEKIIPNIDPKTIIGVRVPEVRKLAKKYINTKEGE